MESLQRIRRALLVLAGVLLLGTIGYVLLGFTVIEAMYQAVTTMATVGFREVHPLGTGGQIFTMVFIGAGVGAVLYNLSVIFEAVTEGHLRAQLRRNRMDREIAGLRDHVVVCGYGRVGQAAVEQLLGTGVRVVAVDRDPGRFEAVPAGLLHQTGDVTSDATLRAAGIDRAQAVIVALDEDADTVYATLSARAMNARLTVVSRASTPEAKDKVELAGATRAVNPHGIGGRRMAVYALQPEVSDFLDVVMHDEGLDYRMREFTVTASSPLCGTTIADADVQQRTGAMLLALRPAGSDAFRPRPAPDARLADGAVLIALGTESELEALAQLTGAER